MAHAGRMRAWRVVTGYGLVLLIGGGMAGAVALGQPSPTVRNGSLPAVSPDGRRIAFVSDRDGMWDLYVVAADGRGTVRLTRSAEEESAPAWTSEGRVLYRTMAGGRATLRAVDPDGSGDRALVELSALEIRPSNDGGLIAYTAGSWTQSRIMVASADGTGATAITDSASAWYNLAWSPDDRQIAATRRDSSRTLQVWLLDAGGGSRPLTQFAPADGRPQWPAWSPDGARVAVQAVVSDREHPGRSTAHLWVIQVASGEARKIGAHATPWLDETPSWFPDGKRLAFQSNRTGRMEIWTINADGTKPRQVTR